MIVEIPDEYGSLLAEVQWLRGMQAIRPNVEASLRGVKAELRHTKEERNQARAERDKCIQTIRRLKAELKQFAQLESLIRIHSGTAPRYMLAELEQIERIRLAEHLSGRRVTA